MTPAPEKTAQAERWIAPTLAWDDRQLDRLTAPSLDWQARSLDRATAAFRRMMAPTERVSRGRHQFTDASGLIERENGL